jgi:hypothetical protein
MHILWTKAPVMRMVRRARTRTRKKEIVHPIRPAHVVMMLSTKGFDSPAIKKKYCGQTSNKFAHADE